MTDLDRDNIEETMTAEEFRKLGEDEGRQIDPETAEVTFWWGYLVDPYNVYPDIPEEAQCTGRLYFARASGSDCWVSFYDLPKPTRERLWKLHRSKIEFPAVANGLTWFDLLNLPEAEALERLRRALGGAN